MIVEKQLSKRSRKRGGLVSMCQRSEPLDTTVYPQIADERSMPTRILEAAERYYTMRATKCK